MRKPGPLFGLVAVLGCLPAVAAPPMMQPDSERERIELAIAASIHPQWIGSRTIKPRAMELKSYPGVRFYWAEVPGPHQSLFGGAAVLPDGSVLPLGCRSNAALLSAFARPAHDSASLISYAVELAKLEDVSVIQGHLVREQADVPPAIRDRVRATGGIHPPSMRTMPSGQKMVTFDLLIEPSTIVRKSVLLGNSRRQDLVAASEAVFLPPN